jgi:hypothetical protein
MSTAKKITPITENVTTEEIRGIIKSRIESDLPDVVLEILKADDGKQLTKRILTKLPGGEETWRITHVATMTHLETWEYCRSQGVRGIHLLLAYETKNLRINAKWIEERNPAYFEARRERNEKRRAALANLPALEAVAGMVNATREARVQLAEIEGALSEFTEYGALFEPESQEISDLTKIGDDS